MNDSYALLQTIGGPSSSVDPSPDSSRTDEEYMERHGHPRFPAAWYPYKRRGQTLDYYLESLKRFYTIHNGMAVLHNEVCKCVLYPAIPPDLVVVHIEDEIFDTKALRKGYSCELTEDQEVGLKTRDADTAAALLLHTMSECYFKKKGIISKTAEIQRLQKRFSELSLEEITELETSVERRNEELSPAFEKCLAQQNEIELHEGFKRLYIQTWKLQAMFSKNESEQIQKMDDLTKSYSDAMKASEAKNSIISNEVKKWKSKSANNEKRISEQNVSISKLKKQEEFYRKQYERNERELKEANSEIKSILQDNKSFQQTNFEIQEKRANMQTNLSRLTEENKQLALNLKQALEREVHNEAKIKSMETELSRTKNILKKLEAERTHMTSEINSVKANKENLLTRLSEVAGAKLTDGNTEITDLSDPDRPTKIGERFREIYDNEWTEALEELTVKAADISDRMALDFLLDVLMNSFRFCSETLTNHADNCYQSFEELPNPSSVDLQACVNVPLPRVTLKEDTKKRIDCSRREVVPAMEKMAKRRCMANIEVQLRRMLQQGNATTVPEIPATNIDAVNEDTDATRIGGAMEKSSENDWTTTDSFDISLESGKREEKTKSITRENGEDEIRNKGSSSIGSQFEESTSSNSVTPSAHNGQVQEMDEFYKGDNFVHGDSRESTKTPTDSNTPSVDEDGNVTMKNANELSSETKENIPSDTGENTEGFSEVNSKPTTVDEKKTRTHENDLESETIEKQSRDCKTIYISACDEAGQVSLKTFSKVYKYWRECFHLCWLMRNHSPELQLDEQIQKGSEFDPNRFRHYTQTGKKVEFVVWPALHLYQGGPLLAKGVAQPIKDKNRNNTAQQQT